MYFLPPQTILAFFKWSSDTKNGKITLFFFNLQWFLPPFFMLHSSLQTSKVSKLYTIIHQRVVKKCNDKLGLLVGKNNSCHFPPHHLPPLLFYQSATNFQKVFNPLLCLLTRWPINPIPSSTNIILIIKNVKCHNNNLFLWFIFWIHLIVPFCLKSSLFVQVMCIFFLYVQKNQP